MEHRDSEPPAGGVHRRLRKGSIPGVEPLRIPPKGRVGRLRPLEIIEGCHLGRVDGPINPALRLRRCPRVVLDGPVVQDRHNGEQSFRSFFLSSKR